MRISALARVIGGALVVGFLGVLTVGFWMYNELKIRGPLYDKIILGKDLVADVLPPPAYVIEAFLEVNLARGNPESVAASRANLARLRKDYEARHDFWQAQNLGGDLNQHLVLDTHVHAEKFWTLVETEFLPALEQKNSARANDAFTAISDAYAKHREAIDKVVVDANKLNAETEAYSANRESVNIWAIGGMGSAMAAIIVIAIFGAQKRLSVPLTGLAHSVQELAKGNFDVKLPTERSDEIGDIAVAIGNFKSMLEEKARRDAQTQMENEARAAALRKAELLKIADQFQKAVGQVVEAVAGAASRLETTAASLTQNAETTQGLSTLVAAASEQTSANVQGVAAASEELSSTVAEIGRQVNEASSMAASAAKHAMETNQQVHELSNSTEKIGSVVDLIKGIASQTNLLALNATIEAARAGEAGKGFSVVAHEVKQLASQTEKATGEIAAQISAIQLVTHNTASAIHDVTSMITRLSEYACNIAAAVEQQDATTKEISRNVNEAARGTSEVAIGITDVSKGASQTGAASSMLLQDAKSLSNEGRVLRAEVERFLGEVRAA